MLALELEETTDSTIRNDKNIPDWQKNLIQKYISRPAKVSQFSITFVWYKIKWNGNFRKVRLENFGQLLELDCPIFREFGNVRNFSDFISIRHSA